MEKEKTRRTRERGVRARGEGSKGEKLVNHSFCLPSEAATLRERLRRTRLLSSAFCLQKLITGYAGSQHSVRVRRI
jgi:hypothetical protein